MKKIKSLLAISVISFALAACSSAPKRPMLESTIYDASVTYLESANACILNGDYEKADFLLNEAYKNAMSVDNYDLLTSILLTRISLNLSLKQPNFEAADEALGQARLFASHSDFSESQTALCVLGEVRIAVARSNSSSNDTNYSELLKKLNDGKNVIKGDAYNEAHFDAAAGDIYKLQKKYTEAEASYMAAAKAFTDNRYLSEIGINWYKVAQMRSLNGNKAGALEALDNAIYYDRLAENSLALGTDYYAKGTVLLKGTPTAAEKDMADFAFKHSADIFEAAGIK